MLAAFPRSFECIPYDTLDALTREDVRLERNLVPETGMHSTAYAGVLALGVLPNAEHVDVLWPLVAQRASHAGKEFHWSGVDIQVESLSDRQQEAPQRHMIGHVR